MKSKLLRWYKRHERAVHAVFDIACDAVPGGNIVKGIINIAHADDLDDEKVVNNEKIKQLKLILKKIKFKHDFIEEIENLEEFKQARNLDDIKKAMYKKEHITQELNKVVPMLSGTITRSAQKLNSLGVNNDLETISNGKYVLKNYLGSGGEGVVFYGENSITGSEVAIKLLPQELTVNNYKVEMLKSEYQRLVSKLSHSNIIQYRDLDFCKNKNQWFIVMDYINGYTLRKPIFERGGKGFSVQEIYDYLFPVGQALEYAHNNGIVHCDLKPENIMISKDNKVFLADFGLAKEFQFDTLHLPEKSLSMGGTPPYMSPEQYQGKKVTHTSDIWSLGVIMYEMLSGKHPFQGTSYEHYKDVICNKEPLPLKNNLVWNIIQQALYKEAQKRPSSAELLLTNIIDDKNIEIHDEVMKNDTGLLVQVESYEDLYKEGMSYVLEAEGCSAQERNECYLKALEYLELAARGGNVDSMLESALIYDKKLDLNSRDSNKAAQWYEKVVESGDERGADYLGDFYQSKMLCESDKEAEENFIKSIKYYEMSANNGNLESMLKVAKLFYYQKKNCSENKKKAMMWYLEAAKKNSISALYALGNFYSDEMNYTKRMHYLYELINVVENLDKTYLITDEEENKYVESIVELGQIYEYRGKGLNASIKKKIAMEINMKEESKRIHFMNSQRLIAENRSFRRKVLAFSLTYLAIIFLGVEMWSPNLYSESKKRVFSFMRTGIYTSLGQLHANYWGMKNQKDTLRKISILTDNKFLRRIPSSYSLVKYDDKKNFLKALKHDFQYYESKYEEYIVRYHIAKLHKLIAFEYHNSLDKLFSYSFNRSQLTLLNIKLGGHGYVQCTQQKYEEIVTRLKEYKKSEIAVPLLNAIKESKVDLKESSILLNKLLETSVMPNITPDKYYEIYSNIIKNTKHPGVILYVLKNAYEHYSLQINENVSKATKEFQVISKPIFYLLRKFDFTTSHNLKVSKQWEVKELFFLNDLRILSFLYGTRKEKYDVLLSIKKQSDNQKSRYLSRIGADITRYLLSTEIPLYELSNYNSMFLTGLQKEEYILSKTLDFINGTNIKKASSSDKFIKTFHRSMENFYFNKFLNSSLKPKGKYPEELIFLFDFMYTYKFLNKKKLDFKKVKIPNFFFLSHYILSEAKYRSDDLSKKEYHSTLLAYELDSFKERDYVTDHIVRKKYFIGKQIIEQFLLRFDEFSEFEEKIYPKPNIDFASNELEKFYQANIETKLYPISAYNYIKMMNTLQNIDYITALKNNKYISSGILYKKLSLFRNELYIYLHNSVRDIAYHKELIDLMLIPYVHVRNVKEKKIIYRDIKNIINGFKSPDADRDTGEKLLNYVKKSLK